MKVNYINPFINATQKVLTTMAYVESSRGIPVIKKGNHPEGDVSAIIKLVGGIGGSISITFSRNCILAIAENMLGETFEELSQDIADMVGEIINMISGEARRELSELGFQFDAGIPVTLMGDHKIDHSEGGPIIKIPFETESGKFTLEACFESEEFFEESARSQEEGEIKESNNSLYEVELGSFLSLSTPFTGHFLKKNTQITSSNLFLLPEYVACIPGFDECNYMKLEVMVCPETYFASNRTTYFRKEEQAKIDYLRDRKFTDVLTKKLAQLKMVSLGDAFYTHNRSIEQGITSFNLAMFSSNQLFNLNREVFWDELRKASDYTLKAALLCKFQLNQEREIKYLRSAYSLQKKEYNWLESLQRNFEQARVLYLMTAIALYLGELEDAKKSAELQIMKFRKEYEKLQLPEEKKQVKLFFELTKQIWSGRDAILASRSNREKKNYLFEEFNFNLSE